MAYIKRNIWQQSRIRIWRKWRVCAARNSGSRWCLCLDTAYFCAMKYMAWKWICKPCIQKIAKLGFYVLLLPTNRQGGCTNKSRAPALDSSVKPSFRLSGRNKKNRSPQDIW